MAIFEKNIAALGTYNQQLATNLVLLKDKKLNYEVVMGDDPVNLNLVDTKDYEPMYSGIPIDEMISMLEEFKKFKRYPYLYFFGLGNGIFYKLLLDNAMHKRVVVFEPDDEIVFIIFNLVDLSQELSSKRLILLSSQTMDLNTYYILFDNEAKIFAKTYDLHVISHFYEKKYYEEILRINYEATKILEQVITSYGNDVNDSLIGLENFLHNLPSIPKLSTLDSLIENLKSSKTVVLAATGPSLYKQLPLLYAIQESVTIFCIDASFPILVESGIKPDLVFSIERVMPTSSFYKQVENKFGSDAFRDVTLALTSIVHEATFEVTGLNKEIAKKANVMLINRPLGYLKMFELDEWGYIGRGMSAANMAFEMTFQGDFENVIIIGQDLAYGKDGESHTKGNIWGENQIDAKDSDLQTVAYGGEGTVKTSEIWKLFLNFYEKDVEDFKNLKPDTHLINATEGGARISGMTEMSFEKAVEQCVDLSHRKKPIKVEKPDPKLIEEKTKMVQVKLQSFINSGEEVKEEIEAVFLKVAKTCEKLDSLNKADKLDEIDYDELVKIIEEIDKVKQLIQSQPFSFVYMDLLSVYMVSQELELAKIQVANSETQEDKKTKMVEWVFAHRYWLFSLAGGVDSILSLFKEAKKAVMQM